MFFHQYNDRRICANGTLMYQLLQMINLVAWALIENESYWGLLLKNTKIKTTSSARQVNFSQKSEYSFQNSSLN